MKQFLVLILLAICLLSQSFLSFSRTVTIYPISDTAEMDIPRNLRTTMQTRMRKPFLNFQGLDRLKISGSGQFSGKTFAAMLGRLTLQPERLIVLDLREESHGFINGNPVSWTDGIYNYANISKTKCEIESDEYQRLRLAAQAKQIVISPLEKPAKITVYLVQTERELVESYGATYVRLPVTDHNRPSNEVIDQFIALVKNLSPQQWLHMHCKAGKGRTTTFLTLFDIMQNAQHVNLKDILARQYWIGGIDLTQVHKKDRERTRAASERLEFIRQFYVYCRQVPHFQISWSEWVEKQQSRLIFADNHS